MKDENNNLLVQSYNFRTDGRITSVSYWMYMTLNISGRSKRVHLNAVASRLELLFKFEKI